MSVVTDWRPGCGLILALVLAGCETPHWAQKLDEAFAPGPDTKAVTAEAHEHREKYVTSRDSASLRWLLAHKVDAGMPYDEVCRVLGEQGEHEERKNWLIKGDSTLQIGDDAYGFGPDNKGKKYMLFFRDNLLVNFDPDDYK